MKITEGTPADGTTTTELLQPGSEKREFWLHDGRVMTLPDVSAGR